MAEYRYARVRRLDESLHRFAVAPQTIDQIMEGGEALTEKTKPVMKSDWLREAMCKMDRLIEPGTRHHVREACACCLGGKRQQISKAIGNENSTLEDRVRAANEARFVFGHSVSLEDDGHVVVQFAPDGEAKYGCPCLPQAREPMPVTYCYCCGGHVKHHLQNALGRKLEVTVLHTALSTGGKKPCKFRFAIAD